MLPIVTALRPQVELLIVLSHVGHEEEIALARDIPGIDIIVGGHSHTRVQPPLKVGNTYVVQAGYYGAYVGKIEVTVDTDANAMTSFIGTLIPAADLPAPLKKVDRLVKRWEKKVARQVDFKIASADRDYTKVEMQPYLQKILASASGADLGYYNMGGIRDVFRKGTVTARHIWNIEPFSNQLVTITAQGRLESLLDDKTYVMATNDFIAAQAEKSFGSAIVIKDQGLLIRDLLVDYVKTQGLDIAG